MTSGSEVLGEVANFWDNILSRLPLEIKAGKAKIYSYTQYEGIEGDLSVYVWEVTSGDYRFSIKCFYPAGSSKELRRLIVEKKKRWWIFSIFTNVVCFDINEIINRGQSLSKLSGLPDTCVQIHCFLDRMEAEREIIETFSRAL